jgi:hypothetical protein
MGRGDVQEVALELLELLPKGTGSSGGGTASAAAVRCVDDEDEVEDAYR